MSSGTIRKLGKRRGERRVLGNPICTMFRQDSSHRDPKLRSKISKTKIEGMLRLQHLLA